MPKLRHKILNPESKLQKHRLQNSWDLTRINSQPLLPLCQSFLSVLNRHPHGSTWNFKRVLLVRPLWNYSRFSTFSLNNSLTGCKLIYNKRHPYLPTIVKSVEDGPSIFLRSRKQNVYITCICDVSHAKLTISFVLLSEVILFSF